MRNSLASLIVLSVLCPCLSVSRADTKLYVYTDGTNWYTETGARTNFGPAISAIATNPPADGNWYAWSNGVPTQFTPGGGTGDLTKAVADLTYATLQTRLPWGWTYPYAGAIQAGSYGEAWQVSCSDTDAGLQTGWYVQDGGTFAIEVHLLCDSANTSKTAGGVLVMASWTNGATLAWNIFGGNAWDLPIPDTANQVAVLQYTSNVVISSGTHVGMAWYKDDNAGGASGVLRIKRIYLVRQ